LIILIILGVQVMSRECLLNIRCRGNKSLPTRYLAKYCSSLSRKRVLTIRCLAMNCSVTMRFTLFPIYFYSVVRYDCSEGRPDLENPVY
jgi:hypothetical protein